MTQLLRRFLYLLLILAVAGIRDATAQQYVVDTLAHGPQAQFPVSIAFLPDHSGRIFFTEKNSGQIRIIDGRLLPNPFATVAVEDGGEQGLLGIAIHPSYPDSPFVYVFYTRRIDRSNVVERYRDSSGTGIYPELVLICPRQDDGTTNNGGSLHFGPDGKLYIGIGDYGTNPQNAQDISSRKNQRGKILRLNDDGSIPADNPFPRKPFWAYGLRDPMGITIDQKTETLYCTDGGLGGRNEIHVVPPGANLGWPDDRAGIGKKSSREYAPLYATPGPEQPGLTGIVMYRAMAFPRLRGKLLFGGSENPTIWQGSLTEEGDSLVVSPFFKSNAGYADIEVGPDGFIYFTNGPYISSRLLRIVPVQPSFTSTPPMIAKQGVEYTYSPTFNGTPPLVSLVQGPEGMVIDSASWTVHWTPTNSEALTGSQDVILRAENGAGSVDQAYTIAVANINDPPSPFDLELPLNNAAFTFIGNEPIVTFAWHQALDPDRDTVLYMLQIDTVNTFTSPARQDTLVGTDDSLRFVFPRISRDYYWRVIASDGKLTTVSTPRYWKLSLSFVRIVREERDRTREPLLEQNFPNPFNPATSIKYSIPRGGHVKLTVYNLLGQEVARLFEGEQSEGTYELEFAKANLPSGIYFYRIQAPGFIETKKMVITK